MDYEISRADALDRPGIVIRVSGDLQPNEALFARQRLRPHLAQPRLRALLDLSQTGAYDAIALLNVVTGIDQQLAQRAGTLRIVAPPPPGRGFLAAAVDARLGASPLQPGELAEVCHG